ncbi:Uncharacterised protein [Mycobacteroides abscessus subsp. abscessus]|nr:Uncharacterised protein [Mycobacteroides abscessus subsp. abscessus]
MRACWLICVKSVPVHTSVLIIRLAIFSALPMLW